MEICRFCLKPVENDQQVKEFPSGEKCHLECWKQNKDTLIVKIIEVIMTFFLK